MPSVATKKRVPKVAVKKSAPKRTFKHKVLEADFLKYCQLSSEAREPSPPVSIVEALVKAADDHIGSASFAEKNADVTILGDQLLVPDNVKPTRSAKLDALPPHLAGLCEHPLLTQDAERTMFLRMNFLKYTAAQVAQKSDGSLPSDQWDIERIDGLLRAAKWHRDKIVQANLRLVISIVKKFSNKHCSFDDLLSDGIVALMRAVEKFDIERGFRFSTYATQVVRRNCYRMVMERQQERTRVTNSMHEPGMDVAEQSHDSSMSEVRWNALRNRLGTLLNQLDRREKFIIRARFSLGGHRRVQTLQTLADVLGVSKERIRQLEKRAMDKMRLLAEASPVQLVEADPAE